MKDSRLLIILMAVVLLLISWLFISKGENEENTQNLNETEISKEETQILLYFLNAEKTKLVGEYRYVNMEDIKNDMLKTIAVELIKGPTSAELKGVIKSSTKVNNITLEDSKLIIDFSKEFEEASDDENTKLQKIYSVVNTFTEIKEIEEVEIRIEGKTLTTKKRL